MFYLKLIFVVCFINYVKSIKDSNNYEKCLFKDYTNNIYNRKFGICINKTFIFDESGILKNKTSFNIKNNKSNYYITKNSQNIVKQKKLKKYNFKNNIFNYLKDFFDCEIKEKTIIIFEPNRYHHECIPGYAKYFTDLGYNVDTLIIKKTEDSLLLFHPKEKLRIFLFDNLKQIEKNIKKIKNKFKKYDYIFINSTDKNKKEIYKNLGVFDFYNSIFVAHDINFIKRIVMDNLFNENKIITLGKFKKGVQVNPHYFGNYVLRNKNNKTKFFVTSTINRDYKYLINSVEILKNEGLNFEIVVIGRCKNFNSNIVPENIKNYFIFRHNISYSQMYSEIKYSDYVIITLNPKNKDNIIFKNLRITGSSQLVYGFLKPAIIHKEYAELYNMTNKNSFIYNKNFTDVMREAINFNNKQYNEMRDNLKSLSNKIYKLSFENLKKIMKI